MFEVQVRSTLGTDWQPFLVQDGPLRFHTVARAVLEVRDLRRRFADQGWQYRAVRVDS